MIYANNIFTHSHENAKFAKMFDHKINPLYGTPWVHEKCS